MANIIPYREFLKRIELKPSYWDASVNLMRDLEEKLGEATLF